MSIPTAQKLKEIYRAFKLALKTDQFLPFVLRVDIANTKAKQLFWHQEKQQQQSEQSCFSIQFSGKIGEKIVTAHPGSGWVVFLEKSSFMAADDDPPPNGNILRKAPVFACRQNRQD